MTLSLSEILLRSKEGPIIEEKTFDMSIFMKTQELQKKLEPLSHYRRLYEEVKEKLRNQGLNFRS